MSLSHSNQWSWIDPTMAHVQTRNECTHFEWMCCTVCLDRWWVITPSEFVFMLQIFFKIWMHQRKWEANCSCSYFETSSDSFRFLVRLLTNFCVLVRLNYVSKRGLFLYFGLKTLCLINIKQNTSNRGRVNPTALHHWPSTDFREAHSAGCQSLCHGPFVRQTLKVFAWSWLPY